MRLIDYMYKAFQDCIVNKKNNILKDNILKDNTPPVTSKHKIGYNSNSRVKFPCDVAVYMEKENQG